MQVISLSVGELVDVHQLLGPGQAPGGAAVAVRVARAVGQAPLPARVRAADSRLPRGQVRQLHAGERGERVAAAHAHVPLAARQLAAPHAPLRPDPVAVLCFGFRLKTCEFAPT